MKIIYHLLLGAALFTLACQTNHQASVSAQANADWEDQFNKRLPLLGHRNWILIVDKAYPEQTSPGIQTIYTNQNLLSVLQYVKTAVSESSHVDAEIYTDKELGFLTTGQVPRINNYRDSLKAILDHDTAQSILHDSVFVKIDEATKLFKVLVLKTNETIPYSSVFMRLNCAYWGADSEKQLRNSMKQ